MQKENIMRIFIRDGTLCKSEALFLYENNATAIGDLPVSFRI